MKKIVQMLPLLVLCLFATSFTQKKQAAFYIGTWYYGDVSSTEYYQNGSWSNAVGSNQSYTFHEDGTFEFGYRNYATVFSCTNVGMAYRKGRYTVEGNTLTLYDQYSKIMEQHSCNPSSNYDRNAPKATEVLIAEAGTDQYGYAGLYLRHPDTRYSFFKRKPSDDQ
jgi:hypothetical protein